MKRKKISGFREIEKEMLAGMIARRDLLNSAIASLQESLVHSPYVSNIDFAEIEKMAKRDMDFLEDCERKRLKEEARK